MFFTIEKPVIDPVLKMLNEEGITTFSGLFSMFYLFLSQLTGQEDIVIGINTSGRMQDELNGVVGMFTKTLPIRYEAAMDLSFKTMVKEVHKRLVQANSKQVYDLSDILAELNNNRATPVKSLFDVMFVLQNFEDKAAQSRNDGFFSYDFENNTSKFPITLFATESEDGFNFRMEYLSNYFTKADAGLLVTQFKSLAKKIAQNVNGKLSEYLAQATQPVQFAEDNISFNF
jgi:non-ribosomal peptide synthetase component F